MSAVTSESPVLLVNRVRSTVPRLVFGPFDVLARAPHRMLVTANLAPSPRPARVAKNSLD